MSKFLLSLLCAVCIFISSGCGSSSDSDYSEEYNEVKTIADQFMSRILIKEDFASLMNHDEFLYSGMDAEEYIADTIANVENVNYKIIFNDSYIEKISDGLYRFYEINKVDILENNIVVKEETVDDYSAQKITGYIKKINGTWQVIGNQLKSSVYVEFSEISHFFSVEGHSSYPINSVNLSSSSLKEPISLTQSNLYWDVYLDAEKSYEEESFTITINYTDGTSSTHTYTIPKMTEVNISINSVVQNTDGTVTVNYSVPSDDNSSFCEIAVNDFRSYKILWGSNINITLPIDAFRPGENTIYLGFYDIYSRYYMTSHKFKFSVK